MSKKTETAPVQKWEHLGVTITMDVGSRGVNFRATAKGKNLVASTLQTIKKQITSALDEADKCKPFGGIYIDHGYRSPSAMKFSKVKGVRIVDKRDRRIGGGLYEFETEQGYGSRTESTVIADTPENRRRVQNYIDLENATRAEKDRLEKELNEAKAALPWLNADDVALGKVKVPS